MLRLWSGLILYTTVEGLSFGCQLYVDPVKPRVPIVFYNNVHVHSDLDNERNGAWGVDLDGSAVLTPSGGLQETQR